MPKGGARPGAGRPPGPSRATVEKALIAERTVQEARATGKKLGKERLEELMEIFIGATAYFQPALAAGAQNANANWDKFEKWARLAMECAAKLTPYQSPTFRAIAIAPPPVESDVTKRFTLTIFEQHKRDVAVANEIIDVESVAVEND